MQKTLTPNRRRADAATWITVAIIAAVYIAVFVLEQILPATSMLFTAVVTPSTT